MKRNITLAAGIALASLALTNAPAAHAQITYTFTRDTTFNTTMTEPITTSGTLTFATNPGFGTFTAAQAGLFTLNFNIGAETFTETDFEGDLAQVRFIFSDSAGQNRLQFSDDGDANGSNGSSTGSFELQNANGVSLSFSPARLPAGLGPNTYAVSSGPSGTYRLLQQSIIPEAGTLALILPALGMIGAVVARRRNKS